MMDMICKNGITIGMIKINCVLCYCIKIPSLMYSINIIEMYKMLLKASRVRSKGTSNELDESNGTKGDPA